MSDADMQQDLFMKCVTSNCGGKWATWKTHIIKESRLVQHIPIPVWQSKRNHHKGCTSGILWWERTAGLETDASGLGLGASFLHARDEMWFQRNEPPLYQLAFAKAWPALKPGIATLEESYTTWPRKIPSLMFQQRSQYNNRPQTACGNLRKRCSKLIMETTKNITMHLSVQHKITVQT